MGKKRVIDESVDYGNIAVLSDDIKFKRQQYKLITTEIHRKFYTACQTYFWGLLLIVFDRENRPYAHGRFKELETAATRGHRQ